MSIFGDETIPAFESPDTGHEEEAAVDTEIEQEEVKETDADVDTEEEVAPEGHADELLAGKYKTVEELTKGYKNLEAQFHKSRQQPVAQTPQHQQQPKETPEEFNERVYNAFNADPAGTINFLVQQQLQQALAPIQQERQLNSLNKNIEPIANEYAQLHTDEGAEQFFAKVREIAEDLGNPQLMQNPSQRVLRMAATELWGNESKSKIYDKAKEAGRIEAENARKNKLGVAVSVSQKPNNNTPKTEADIIREGILGAGSRGGIFG